MISEVKDRDLLIYESGQWINRSIDEIIDKELASICHINRIILESKDEIYEYLNESNYKQYIFMIPTGLELDSDKYDEYIILETNDGHRFVEQVGSWEVNLDDYATKEELSNYVEKVDGSRLISAAEISKLENIFPKAEKNIINSVSDDFTIGEDRQLNLNDLNVNKVSGLTEILDQKIDRQEGYELLSSEDKKKLDALQLNGDDLQVSGNVNTSQIVDLPDWLKDNAGSMPGLSEYNITDKLYNKLNDLAHITTVDPTQLAINTDGLLQILNIEQSQVNGLEENLNKKVNNTEFQNLIGQLNNINAKVDNLEERFTWHEI